MDDELDLTQFDGHAPGPWMWRETEASDYVRRAFWIPGICHHINNEATARLIAAAPRLLEEVGKLRRFIKLMGTRERAKWEQFSDQMEDENGKSTL